MRVTKMNNLLAYSSCFIWPSLLSNNYQIYFGDGDLKAVPDI